MNKLSYFWQQKRKFVTGNADKSRFCSSQGNVKTIGSAKQKKHKKSKNDFCDGITVLNNGTTVGTVGPSFFSIKGKKKIVLPTLRTIIDKYTLKYSDYKTTPSGYITTKAWDKICESLSKDIRNLPEVNNHPDWWLCLCLDGFKSHLSPYIRMIFAKYKILVCKEERESSQTNQAYDQNVTKCKKILVGEALQILKTKGKSISLNQMMLTALVSKAINKVPGKKWGESFMKVNLHHDHCILSDKWVKKIDIQLEGEILLKR